MESVLCDTGTKSQDTGHMVCFFSYKDSFHIGSAGKLLAMDIIWKKMGVRFTNSV